MQGQSWSCWRRSVLRAAAASEVSSNELAERTFWRASCWPGVAGGCLYLFDRRAVRFFRKDGHNWRKKADGKTVRETHEKLKARSGRAVNDTHETRGPHPRHDSDMIAIAVRHIRAVATL